MLVGDEDDLYARCHDEEWERPVADDVLLFEKICLEGFQLGLSWITISRKRESFRKAFKLFEVADGRIGSIYVVLNPDKLRTRRSTNPQPPNADSASIQIR